MTKDLSLKVPPSSPASSSWSHPSWPKETKLIICSRHNNASSVEEQTPTSEPLFPFPPLFNFSSQSAPFFYLSAIQLHILHIACFIHADAFSARFKPGVTEAWYHGLKVWIIFHIFKTVCIIMWQELFFVFCFPSPFELHFTCWIIQRMSVIEAGIEPKWIWTISQNLNDQGV